MKLKLSQHAKLRLFQRFGYNGKKKLKHMTFEHIRSEGCNKRLFKIKELGAYFWRNKASKKVITFLTEDMV